MQQTTSQPSPNELEAEFSTQLWIHKRHSGEQKLIFDVLQPAEPIVRSQTNVHLRAEILASFVLNGAWPPDITSPLLFLQLRRHPQTRNFTLVQPRIPQLYDRYKIHISHIRFT